MKDFHEKGRGLKKKLSQYDNLSMLCEGRLHLDVVLKHTIDIKEQIEKLKKIVSENSNGMSLLILPPYRPDTNLSRLVPKIIHAAICRYVAYIREDWDNKLPQTLLPTTVWPKTDEDNKHKLKGHIEIQDQVVVKYELYMKSCKAIIDVGPVNVKEGSAELPIDLTELIDEVRLAWTHPFELVTSRAQSRLVKPTYAEQTAGKGAKGKGKANAKNKDN